MRFVPSRGLDAKVAVMVAPAITRLAEIAADGARAAAPDDKEWVTVGDDRVRDQHREAHGQTVPANLRFTLNSPAYDMGRYGAGPQQMARAPRDPNLTPGLRVECRCHAVTVEGLAADITAHPATVAGTSVSASITCEHHLCVTAEFGTASDQGARMFAAGLREAGRRLRR